LDPDWIKIRIRDKHSGSASLVLTVPVLHLLKICYRKEDRFCIDEWLQYPSFLKLVQEEQVWINTYLSAKRNGAFGLPLFM
jgi:hypothetical protein